MSYVATATVTALSLLVGMLLFLELGRRMGRRQLARGSDPELLSSGALDGAVFGLLGLLLAFTFSGAASRFDGRRELIIQEANAIGTAYLRVDLLPAESREPIRALFREYVKSRLATYRKIGDDAATRAEFQRSVQLQGEIWSRSIEAARQVPSPAVLSLVAPALNEMIDITTTRLAATRMHPPLVIFGMLFVLALAASLLAGYGLARTPGRNWAHTITFAVVIAASCFVILDLEFPRYGFIRVDAFDSFLVDVLASMK